MRTVDFNLSRRRPSRQQRTSQARERNERAAASSTGQDLCAGSRTEREKASVCEPGNPGTRNFFWDCSAREPDESRTPGENIHVVLSSNFGPSPTGAPDTTYSSAPFAFGFDVVRVNPCSHSDRSSSGLARARTKHGVSDEGRRSAEKTDFNTKVSEWCARSHQAHGHPSRPWERPVR